MSTKEIIGKTKGIAGQIGSFQRRLILSARKRSAVQKSSNVRRDELLADLYGIPQRSVDRIRKNRKPTSAEAAALTKAIAALIRRGVITDCGAKTYQLTSEGRRLAHRFATAKAQKKAKAGQKS